MTSVAHEVNLTLWQIRTKHDFSLNAEIELSIENPLLKKFSEKKQLEAFCFTLQYEDLPWLPQIGR